LNKQAKAITILFGDERDKNRILRKKKFLSKEAGFPIDHIMLESNSYE